MPFPRHRTGRQWPPALRQRWQVPRQSAYCDVAGVFASLLFWRTGDAAVVAEGEPRAWRNWGEKSTAGPGQGAATGTAHRRLTGHHLAGRVATCCSPPVLPAGAPGAAIGWARRTGGGKRLLIEWPITTRSPLLPADIGFERMVKLRWRIEHDYLELRQEVGLRPLRVPPVARLSALRQSLHRGLWPWSLRAGNFPPQAVPSIATLRLRLARTLVRALPRCPFCGQRHQRTELTFDDAAGLGPVIN